MYVQERSQTGATRRLPATEVFNFFSQNNIQTQLVQHLAVGKAFPKTGMTGEQLKQYLDNPPAGVLTSTDGDLTKTLRISRSATLSCRQSSLCGNEERSCCSEVGSNQLL